ncbi:MULTISPECIES: FHA domain-containing protein [Deinococcus]|uniref:FHA domain-containing protein n=1 Tax=Deinococcus rufus TaxID=2136097 RepID=A0ABV7ZBZ5_9DEIO|nr:FHA domain-containing protein [Deinococcus sp. AB2017081]WQE95688.1 FHA domain-containing protein [Deinococcus sp. AB2017081]
MSITCTVCGTVNPDGTTYCEGCGVELSAPQTAAPTPAVENAAPATTDTGLPDMPLPETGSGTTEMPLAAAEIPAAPMDSAPADSLTDTSADSAPAAEATPAPLPMQEAVTPDGDLTPPAAQDGAGPVPVAAAMPAPTAPAPSDAPAKLGIKKYGAPTGEFIPLQGERLVVGRFDASSGPVDIDLTGMGGQEHISRRHAELYRENGAWMVRDLGSTNGVYVKKSGESAFSPRLQEPAALADGDEVAFGNLMLTFHQG